MGLVFWRAVFAAGLFWALVSRTLGMDLSTRESLLLKSLGLSTKPSPRSPAPVPSVLWRVFQKREIPSPLSPGREDACWVEEFNVPGNIIRVFNDQGHFLHSGGPRTLLCLEKRLYFNLSVLEDGEQLTMAQLQLQFGHNSYRAPGPGQVFELRLYRAPPPSLRELPSPPPSRRLLLAQSFVQLHKSLLFNLTQVGRDWRTQSRNLGLVLEISVSGRAGSSALLGRHPGNFCAGVDSFLNASLLVVSLQLGQCKAARKKRSSYYTPVMPSSLCKSRRLYISFSDVGWENWIIAPQGYMANYCLGECPFPLTTELNSTNHAILQTMVHSLDPEGTPQPCCVPIRLSPISVLFYDNHDNVVLRHYEDMVVDECGCR
ncbi:PREDICTED: embryonic growth/differentiation factor 1 [Crocodylus porosus]|uniref:embryonic growth/differentiation factor 1 n=1 Tax=Crocodylus porosus TaxID=8502 RepID=UPI00093A0F05|nr:PREDICTED: embryonic growth/differentiation factor 1 [Crocodylus porosus]